MVIWVEPWIGTSGAAALHKLIIPRSCTMNASTPLAAAWRLSVVASAVSAIPAVRNFLLQTQKSIAEKQSVIMDGRDIGTVIIPDAEVKIFLTASPEERAMRRYKELLEKGKEKPYEEVLAEMNERDSNDSQRAIAPLVPAEDAVIFNNTAYTLEESVEYILDIVKSKSEVAY